MGKTRPKNRESSMLSSQTINRIIANNKAPLVIKDDSVSTLPPDREVITGSKICCDYRAPEMAIKSFVAYARDSVSKYEENLNLITEYDRQTSDILHMIELSDNLGGAEGYKVYKLLRDIRRQRRACKTENDLLRSSYEYVKANQQFFNQLTQLQGNTRLTREAIENRQYVTRTDVLKALKSKDHTTEGTA